MSGTTLFQPANTGFDAPCNAVMVHLTLKPGTNGQSVMSHMPAEVRDTVRLYLDGHITQWYSQCDEPGVVFLFQASSVDAVAALMDDLPLVKEGLADLTFTRLGPLMPLRLML